MHNLTLYGTNSNWNEIWEQLDDGDEIFDEEFRALFYGYDSDPVESVWCGHVARYCGMV